MQAAGRDQELGDGTGNGAHTGRDPGLVGDHEVSKGRSYSRGPAISGAVRVGQELKANVQGTRDRPYRVRVKISDDEVASAECSCPVGDGGRCKHVAAVLLAYHEDPSRFAEVEDIDANLQLRDKAELIVLIKQMVRRAPELEPLLAGPLPGFRKGKPVTPDLYRRQAMHVIRGVNPHDEWAGSELSESLDYLLTIGRDYEKAGDLDSAAAVYQGITSAVADEEIDYLAGYDGVSDIAGELATRLIRCLGRLGPGNPRRESLLRSCHDLRQLYGGLGTNEEGGERLNVLFTTITPGERRTLSGWLRQNPARGREDDFGSEYRSRRIADLLLRVDADVMDDEAFLAHCRRFGLREDLITRLIALGRKDEAVQEVAKSTNNHDVLAL
jgi:hypothetical protein